MTDCNGWTNYETWLANLWLSEEDFIGQWQSASFSEVGEREVRQAIRDWVTTQRVYRADLEYGMAVDMASNDGDWSAINYDELSETLTDDINSVFA